MLCLLSKAAAPSNYLMTGTDPTIRQHPPASYTSLYTAQYGPKDPFLNPLKED
jgi:hypothetical protein